MSQPIPFSEYRIGEEYRLPIVIWETLTSQSITISSSSIARSTRTLSGNTTQLAEDVPDIATNINTCGVLHEGNDTQFDERFSVMSPVTFRPYKLVINLAAGLNISAYTAGSPNLDAVTIEVNKISGTTSQSLIPTTRFNSGLSALAATGSQIFVVSDAVPIGSGNDFVPGDYLELHVQTNTTAGTTTRQEGLLDLFPFQLANVPKMFSRSMIEIVGVRVAPKTERGF